MDSIMQEVRKVLMAGIGLMGYSLEKAQKIIDQLAKRGEITAEQAGQLTAEVAQKLKNKVKDSGVGDWFTEKGRQQSVIRDLEDMSDSARRAVRDAIEDMLSRAECACDKDDSCENADNPCGKDGACENGDNPCCDQNDTCENGDHPCDKDDACDQDCNTKSNQ